MKKRRLQSRNLYLYKKKKNKVHKGNMSHKIQKKFFFKIKTNIFREENCGYKIIFFIERKVSQKKNEKYDKGKKTNLNILLRLTNF